MRQTGPDRANMFYCLMATKTADKCLRRARWIVEKGRQKPYYVCGHHKNALLLEDESRTAEKF